MKIVKYYCDNELHESNHDAEKTIACSFNEETIDLELDVCLECLKKIKKSLKDEINETNDMLIDIRNPESEYFDDIGGYKFISFEKLCDLGFDWTIERKMK